MSIPEILTGTGIPFAYDHFAEGESPAPPFCIYRYPESDNFGADNRVWSKAAVCYIELYTDQKEPETEEIIEEALDDAGIYWDKSEVWIDSEKLYEVLYAMEMEVNDYGR